MARELGMNPRKFGKYANEKQEPWKKALTGIHRGDLFQAVWEKAARCGEKHRRTGARPEREENGAQGNEGSSGKLRERRLGDDFLHHDPKYLPA